MLLFRSVVLGSPRVSEKIRMVIWHRPHTLWDCGGVSAGTGHKSGGGDFAASP